MNISTEAEAVAALDAVVAWAHAKPDSTAEGGATGKTAQRGCVVATRIFPENTLAASTYESPAQARAQAADMERGYRNWLRLRG